MIITHLWSLHYEKFLIQVVGTVKETLEFGKKLEDSFPNKIFLVNRVERGEYDGTGNRETDKIR